MKSMSVTLGTSHWLRSKSLKDHGGVKQGANGEGIYNRSLDRCLETPMSLFPSVPAGPPGLAEKIQECQKWFVHIKENQDLLVIKINKEREERTAINNNINETSRKLINQVNQLRTQVNGLRTLVNNQNDELNRQKGIAAGNALQRKWERTTDLLRQDFGCEYIGSNELADDIRSQMYIMRKREIVGFTGVDLSVVAAFRSGLFQLWGCCRPKRGWCRQKSQISFSPWLKSIIS